MAIAIGESTYKGCTRMAPHAQAPEELVACPFQPGGRSMRAWCHACLVAKIESLQAALLRVSAEAAREAERGA